MQAADGGLSRSHRHGHLQNPGDLFLPCTWMGPHRHKESRGQRPPGQQHENGEETGQGEQRGC